MEPGLLPAWFLGLLCGRRLTYLHALLSSRGLQHSYTHIQLFWDAVPTETKSCQNYVIKHSDWLFAPVPCWNGSFCSTVAEISSQSKGTMMDRGMTSWNCHKTSGYKYICRLGRLKLFCHFFEMRCIAVGSGKNKYQYLECAIKSKV